MTTGERHMDEEPSHPGRLQWYLLLLVLGWAALFLPALGTRELQGEEARRVLPGRTMLQTGDWMVPRSAGKIYNRKPPLINWATALSMKLSGRMNEWCVRMPSVLAMLALALTVLLAGRLWLGETPAFLAAAACLTNIGFLEKGRLAEIEAIYIALFGMALMTWLVAWWRQRFWLAWLGSMLLLGVGFLAKGPVHVWFFYAVIVGVLSAEGSLRELLTLRHLTGLILFVLVWLPWAVANSASNPQQDSGKVWMEQVTHRLGLVEFDWLNWLLQVPQSLVNFLPWALLLPLAWQRRVTAQWPGLGRRGQWLRGLRAGCVVGFLAIALLPSSRPRFMLPMNVAAALLVVECLLLLPLKAQQAWWRRFRLLLLVAGAVSLAVALIVPWQVEGAWARIPLGWFWGAALILIVVWVGLLRLPDAVTGRSVLFGLGSMSLAMSGAVVIVAAASLAPMSTLRDDLRPFADRILSLTGPEPEVVLYKLEERMWPFYLGMNCREVADLADLPAQSRWVLVKSKDIELRRAEMSRRYGRILSEVEVQEPVTGNAGGKGERYTLLEFNGSTRGG